MKTKTGLNFISNNNHFHSRASIKNTHLLITFPGCSAGELINDKYEESRLKETPT